MPGQELEIIKKKEPVSERTMDIRTWSFWLGLYSVLTHKPKKVNIELTEYESKSMRKM